MTGTERKTINKYYPPDFDPRKLPRGRFEPNRQFVQRVMVPFNMRCNTCSEYIYKGKKFNARRETVQEEDYIGLSLFRFYIRCPGCLAEITFKTDLEKCDYSNEHGATRLFEAERLLREELEKTQQQEEEDKTNPMKMLENRTKNSRFEMDALERLEELREINLRQSKPDYEKLLDGVTRERQLALEKQDQEDEDLVSTLFGKTADGKTIKRIRDDIDDGTLLMEPVCSTSTSKEKNKADSNAKKKTKLTDQKALLARIIKRSSKVDASPTSSNSEKSTCQKAASKDVTSANNHVPIEGVNKSSLNLISSYSSSDSDT